MLAPGVHRQRADHQRLPVWRQAPTRAAGEPLLLLGWLRYLQHRADNRPKRLWKLQCLHGERRGCWFATASECSVAAAARVARESGAQLVDCSSLCTPICRSWTFGGAPTACLAPWLTAHRCASGRQASRSRSGCPADGYSRSCPRQLICMQARCTTVKLLPSLAVPNARHLPATWPLLLLSICQRNCASPFVPAPQLTKLSVQCSSGLEHYKALGALRSLTVRGGCLFVPSWTARFWGSCSLFITGVWAVLGL